ncbi:MAG TPA: peptide chain release factor 2, partial [Mycobacterium sp.]|nr:peptide chain release factor 2 [Mycobacterium sp.]
MDPDLSIEIGALDTTLTTVERVLDVDGLRARIANLEIEA